MAMDKETADAMRGMVRRVTLKNVKDDGECQTCSVEVADGIWRDDVEVMQPYGFASHVPQDGALALVLAVGGDQGDLVVMPIGNPSKRMGKLAEGDVGLYNGNGDKWVLKAGGTMDMKTGADLNIKAANSNFDGNITCTGDVSDKNGTMQEMRDRYNAHGHPEASPPPSPTMT